LNILSVSEKVSEMERRDDSATSLTPSRGNTKEDWYEKARWHPTPEEFQAYIEREIVLAKKTLKAGIREDATLFSTATLMRAREELARENNGEEKKP